MFTVISRIVNYGFKNFWRNGWLSAATIAIMLLALLVFGSLVLFRVVTKEAINSVRDKIDISVYFKSGVEEDEMLAVQQSLESIPEVESVEYVSVDEALKRFKENHQDDPDSTILQALGQLDENPLQASLNIKAKETEQYALIAERLTSERLKNIIAKVDYSENKPIIEKLSFFINVINRGGLILTLFLAFIAGMVVFNTISLAIYSNRDEIGIMRVVGASNVFVRSPYMVEGFISGTISLMTLFAFSTCLPYCSPAIKKTIKNKLAINIYGPFLFIVIV